MKLLKTLLEMSKDDPFKYFRRMDAGKVDPKADPEDMLGHVPGYAHAPIHQHLGVDNFNKLMMIDTEGHDYKKDEDAPERAFREFKETKKLDMGEYADHVAVGTYHGHPAMTFADYGVVTLIVKV